MKDDEKKPQREDMPFSSEEDMDFEILDALEQLDQSGSSQSPGVSDETIELNLDDEDMDFGTDASGSGFSFDESLREGLEQELLQSGSDFDIDASLEDDLVKEIQAGSGDDSFALDLDLDQELSSEGLDIESDDSSFDMSAAETLAFKFNKEEHEGGLPSLGDDNVDELGSYNLDLGSESDDIDLGSFSDSDDDFPGLDLGIEGVEISEEFADLGKELELDSSLKPEEEDEAIQAKGVIAVGDDEVIDLGDEEHLAQEHAPASPQQPEAPSFDEDAQEEDEEIPSPPDIALDLHEDGDEELVSSLEDVAIDLEQDTDESPGEVSSSPEEEQTEELLAQIADEETQEEEHVSSESSDMTELVKDALEAQDAEPEAPELPATEEESERVDALEISETEDDGEEESAVAETEESPEEPVEETPVEEEIDVREFLELELRLSDEQVEEFEAMVNEAKTLQAYLDELEEHYGEVKESIYHKLQAEYVDRKTVIFKSEEFTSLLADVKQDLEDMLAKRAGFVETVEHLNEELEEIKVRHLVGEYDDSTLSEKQESQNAEIALWNEKTEKIEVFITRYQESLEAEKVLNPLRQESEEIPEEEPQEEALGLEETIEPAEAESAREEPEEEALPEAESAIEGPEEEAFPEAESAIEEPEEEAFPETESAVEEAEEEVFPEEVIAETAAEEEEELPEEESAEEENDESSIEDFFATGGEDTEADEELDDEFPMDGEFETGDFVLDDLSAFEEEDEEEEDEGSASYDVFGADGEESEEESEEETIACSKCGRQTPAAEKFCIHCGGKAQKATQDANVSCKKCGRQTPAAEKFCIHCGGKAQ